MAEISGDTRSSLLLRLRGNDDHAWAEFFRIYAPAVFRYALRRGLQTSDAEDMAQEVMIEIARGIKNFTYQPEKGRFRDWLGTIAWRRIARHFGGQRTLQTADIENEKVGWIDAEWIDEYQSAILRVAVESIRSRYSDVTWQAFWATWKHGENATQVAIQLGIPIEVVYNSKSRILKHLEMEVLRIADDSPFPLD